LVLCASYVQQLIILLIMNKPYSSACDNNQEPIFSVIEGVFKNCKNVLEVGSGTGQHAVYFAKRMPHLIWHTSDVIKNHEGILAWLGEADLNNVIEPLALDVCDSTWPIDKVDAVFSANAVHIMSWEAVKLMVIGVGELLEDEGLLVLYGPFNYNNAFTSESNARFDVWLKQRNPESGIRNFEDLEEIANASGLYLQNDHEMPANNRILCWKKKVNN
jgi:cyclopropane fatty-acyl-phospholipid synthase-like methyltransferase